MYEDYSAVREYYALIINIAISSTCIEVVANASLGSLAPYTIYAPFSNVLSVTKNIIPLPEMNTPSFMGEGYYVEYCDDYLKVTVKALHLSSIILRIYSNEMLGD